MKLILSICILCFAMNTNAQSNELYTLKLSNISNPQEAKQVTDIIRSIINDSDSPFLNYPTFNDETDTFEFTSSIYLTRGILDEKLSQEGYEVLEFKTRSRLILNSK